MKVRISYGVELDEVPQMVGAMIKKVSAELNNILEQLEMVTQMFDKDNITMQGVGLDLLDQARQTLADGDVGLSDAQNIMTGYVKAMEPESEPEPAAQTPAPVPPSPPTPPEAPSDV